jgi:hypothetical protein
MSHPLLVGVDPHRKTNTVCIMDREGEEAGDRSYNMCMSGASPPLI